MSAPRDSYSSVGRWGGLVLSLLLLQPAYDSSWAAVQIEQTGTVPILRVNVVARSVKAVNYRHRGGATKVDFAGTALQPKSYGQAKVETKKGYTEIEVKFDNLEPATKFGPEFLTYVLWAVSPEGRASNLGEILLDRTDGKLNVTTELQAFGMIVTAEPYFAVTQPSDVVVMENIIRADTKGKIEDIEAKYELLQRGEYTLNVDPSKVVAVRFDPKTTLPYLEARNAIQIARWAGADQYAADTFRKAEGLMQQAQSYQARDEKKSAVQMAREATQTAEDARLIARKRLVEIRQAQEREASAERERQAQLKVREESRLRAEAERAKREAEVARSAAIAQQEVARLEADRARRSAQEAETARAAAVAQQEAARLEADRARRTAQDSEQLRQQAEAEKRELRSRLTEQLNLILETRDSARGLIVNLSDVLFDTGQYTLRSGAREKLSKIAGIVVSHPGLKLEVEGHTDSVGGEEYNQQLSENRAAAVRDYLIRQGVQSQTITARGFGKARPVASNAHAAGKQQNRRVELVVSGEPIGVAVSSLR
jgi:outer membrane protein OmpA-like peptidoglycan-associated protein